MMDLHTSTLIEGCDWNISNKGTKFVIENIWVKFVWWVKIFSTTDWSCVSKFSKALFGVIRWIISPKNMSTSFVYFFNIH